MKTSIKLFFTVALTLLLFGSCVNDDVPNGGKSAIKYARIALNANLSSSFNDVDSLSNITVKLHNVSTGRDTLFVVSAIKVPNNSTEAAQTIALDTIRVAEGLYNIDLEAKACYSNKLKTRSIVRGNLMNQTLVQGGGTELPVVGIDMFFPNMGNGFVIAEIFAARTIRDSGDPYTGDQYFRITNNSDEVLYADGLFIGESAFQQMIHQDYKPYILDKETPVQY